MTIYTYMQRLITAYNRTKINIRINIHAGYEDSNVQNINKNKRYKFNFCKK